MAMAGGMVPPDRYALPWPFADSPFLGPDPKKADAAKSAN